MRGEGELHSLKTWKLQNDREKEVNDVLKDFDELERTGLRLGNAIVARRYPVKYEGKEGEVGTRGQKTEETLKWKAEVVTGRRTGRSGKREASFDGPRVPGLPRDLTLTESQK